MKIGLNRPFPYPILDGNRPKLFSALAFSLFIFLFLLVFRPFGINELEANIPLVTLGFGGVTFFVLLLSYFPAPKLFPNFFNSETWTVSKMLIFGTVQFFSISVFNWFFSAATCDTPLDITGLVGFVLITLAVGIIPASFVLLIMERVLTNQNSTAASLVYREIEAVRSKNKGSELVTLTSDNGKDALSIDQSQLVCIKAEGNYAEITFMENEAVKKKLIRNTLSKIITLFETDTLIKQCHRSYIVNFNYVDQITGNARNYSLHLKEIDATIPVSRSFSKDFIKRFQSNKI